MSTSRLLVVVLLAVACRKDAASKVGNGHQHSASHEEATADGEGLPTISFTVWTQRLEVFTEYPVLVVGHESSFAVHLTTLGARFAPLTAGEVTVELRTGDDRPQQARAGGPTRPGLFSPALEPQKAGSCRLRVLVRAEQLNEQIDAGKCEVHASLERARAAAARTPPQGAGAAMRFSFLKEQQWSTEFASAPATERDLEPTVRLHGEIKPAAGKEARLTAAASGRVQLASPPPVLGMAIRKGQLLGSLLPRLEGSTDRATLESETRSARAEGTATEAQLARAERLFAEQSIPQKTVEEARAAAEVARARLAAARSRLAQQGATARGIGTAVGGTYQIRSPLDGALVAAAVASGETVEEGAALFTVMDLEKVWLEARVFEPDIPKVEQAARVRGARALAGWFSLEGYDAPFRFDASNARLVTLGRVLDPHTRTVPLIFEVDNREGRLRVGQFANIEVASGAAVRLVALPESAVVEESGKPVAYVQVEGEAFERRPLVLALRTAGWVGVRQGIRAGERVVIRGAYDARLASAAGSTPAHGHAH